MKKGYQAGMLSLYDVCNVTLLYEPSNPRKTFNELLTIIKTESYEVTEDQSFENLKFLMKLSRYIVSIKDDTTNFSVRCFLHDLIEKNFDFEYSYNWQELKSILFYCNMFNGIKTFEEFRSHLLADAFNKKICRYLIQDSAILERKEIARTIISQKKVSKINQSLRKGN